MADNEILLKFGLDEKSFNKLIDDFVKRTGTGIEKGLKDLDIGKSILAGRGSLAQGVTDSIRLGLAQSNLATLVSKEIQKGGQEGAKSIADSIRQAVSPYSNASLSAEVRKSFDPQFASPDSSIKIVRNDIADQINNTGEAAKAASVHTDGFSSSLKSMAFSIGLVGYGMENLGRRMLGFAETLLNTASAVAESTEQFDRLKNALVVEGTPEDERNSIEARIKAISRLPGGKLKEVTASFQELRTAGLGAAETLDLIQGLTKAATLSGKGTAGVEQATKVLRRALLASNPFKTQTLDTLEANIGPQVAEALIKRFGTIDAKTLNKIGGKEVVQAISEELSSLKGPLEVPLDTINHIHDTLFLIGDVLLHILSPALDSTLKSLVAIEGVVEGIEKRFDKLSPPIKNFISGLLSGLPIVLAGLGSLVSVLGVLAVGLAVGGKLWKTYDSIIEVLAKSAGTTAKEFSLLGEIATRIAAPFKFFSTLLETIVIQWKQISFFAKGGTSSLSGFGGGFFKGLQELVGGGLGVSLGVIEVTASRLFVTLARIAGLTTPLGLVINTLLALVTNAGHARDVTLAALGDLYISFTKLFGAISEFFEGPVGSGILNFLDTLVNLLGGALGAALSSIILEISALVDLITSLFGLLAHPDSEHLQAFADAFFNFTAGAVIKLGELMAAAFIDAAKQIGPKSGSPLGLGDVLFAVPSIISRNFSSDDSQFLRDKALGTSPEQRQAESIKKTADETKKLNQGLQETQKILSSMTLSFDKMHTNFAKINQELSLVNIKFQNAQAQREAEERIRLAIKATPEEAPSVIASEQAKANARSTAEILETAKIDLKAQGESLRDAFDALNTAVGGAGNVLFTPDKVHLVGDFLKSMSQLATYIEQGGTELQKFENLANQAREAQRQMVAAVQLPTEEAKKEFKEINTASNTMLSVVNNTTQALGKQAQATQGVINANKEKADQENQAAEKQRKATEAAKQVQPLATEKTRLETENTSLEVQKARLNYGQAVIDIDNKIEINRQRILAIDKQILSINKGEKDSVADVNAETQKQIEDIKTRNALDEKHTAETIARNERLFESFKQGFTALDALRQKFLEVADLRASLGLGKAQTGFAVGETDPRFRLEAQGLIQSNLDLGAKTLGRGTEEADLKGVINALSKGIILSDEFIKQLNQLSAVAEGQFKSLTVLIEKNNEEISTKRLELAKAVNAPDDVKNKIKNELDGLLNTQTSLNAQGSIWANRLGVIGILLRQNALLLDNAYQSEKRILEAEKARVELVQHRAELELQLLQAQEDNRIKEGQRAGGGIGALVRSLDPNAVNKAAEESLKKQNELLLLKLKLDLIDIELKKKKLDADLKAHNLTQAEHDELMKDYNDEEDILARLYNQSIDANYLDALNQSSSQFLNTLQNLTDIFKNKIFEDFAEQLRLVLTDSADQLSKFDFAMQTFGDTAATALVAVIDSISQSFIKLLEGGDLGSFGEFLGSLLMQIGETIIQLSAAMVAFAFITEFFDAGGGFAGLIAGAAAAAAAAPMAAVGLAIGAALILAGGALGGKGKYTQTAQTNATNTANAQSGATGTTFDPNKDPKTIYQKALAAQILIDIRTDSSQIVKVITKEVNGNGRLSTLIGNRKLGFGY